MSRPVSLAAANEDPSRDRIDQLIQQLGHKNFAIRERAQNELSAIGVAAFDQVYEAMNHRDLEIARRAQYLARSLNVNWAREDYSPEVRAFLTRYSKQNEDQRSSLIGQLGELTSMDAISALSRISRLEISERLSKEAALVIALNQGIGLSPDSIQQLKETINEEIGNSERTGPVWLRLYEKSLDDPAPAIDARQTLIEQELQTFAGRPERTTRHIVQDLLRWQVEQQRKLGRDDDSLETMRQVIRISQPSSSELIDITTWLLNQRGPQIVEELAAHYADPEQKEKEGVVTGQFVDDANLLYLLAEAKLVQSKIDEATAVADQAHHMNDALVDNVFLTAAALHNRGLIRWAEREYRRVIEKEGALSPRYSAWPTRQLGEMLSDRKRYADAAAIYKPLIDIYDAETKRGKTSDEAEGDRSRYHYFLARAAEQKGDVELAKTELIKANERDPFEVDVLIMMHRISKDSKWLESTRPKIEDARAEFKKTVEDFQKHWDFFKRNGRGVEFLGSDLRTYTRELNQYAWLVGNTYGDLDHAIEASLLSLELAPGEGAYLDTLAHCYYANKDYAKAVECQTEAVEQMPHYTEIREKYNKFADAYEKNVGPLVRWQPPVDPESFFPDEKEKGDK
ncbi:hypothetical protein LOC68_14905 [Blastopirellula sp. JC732]|uniref:Tetratricopeptide repeat protein n=1 Tax=Blastopirellula sediminis TaxID=2894196 RepID=A0A9X1SG10_9BACT|nr:hypothetical protein [Blastopirellula sediminis]MCC9607027.1 hypothetical protein [Blastopirellula sediminis]MCC9629680.1 hypothetical protein [Blastopirellula sediminis]